MHPEKNLCLPNINLYPKKCISKKVFVSRKKWHPSFGAPPFLGSGRHPSGPRPYGAPFGSTLLIFLLRFFCVRAALFFPLFFSFFFRALLLIRFPFAFCRKKSIFASVSWCLVFVLFCFLLLCLLCCSRRLAVVTRRARYADVVCFFFLCSCRSLSRLFASVSRVFCVCALPRAAVLIFLLGGAALGALILFASFFLCSCRSLSRLFASVSRVAEGGPAKGWSAHPKPRHPTRIGFSPHANLDHTQHTPHTTHTATHPHTPTHTQHTPHTPTHTHQHTGRPKSVAPKSVGALLGRGLSR